MNGHLPPLSALRAFETAARLKSFSKAAEELNVTPAAISHQIHALEQDLGVQLFHRLNRAVELTASAKVLLPGLSDAFAGIQASVRRLRAHNDTGTLTVTASPSFAAKWLVVRLHRFQERWPDIDVRISATDNVIDLTAGHGVVLATSTIAAADIAAGRLVRLFSLALPDLFSYYIVTAPGALERAKVKAFRDWLRNEADAQTQ